MRISCVLWTAIRQPDRAIRRLLLPLPSRAYPSRPFVKRFLAGLHITLRLDPRLHAGEDTMPKSAYYAVRAGHVPGVYMSWPEAERQVKGFQGAKHKKFATEAEARAWIDPASGHPPSGADGARALPRSSGKPYPARPTSQAKTGPEPERGPGEPSSSSRSLSRARAAPSSLPDTLRPLAERGYAFTPRAPHRLIVYTDGSSLSNGRARARAGLGVYWGEGEAARRNASERVPGAAQTNNRGELLSIIRALETCPFPDLPMEVRTDSQYAISCMTTFLPKWLRNGFLTANQGGAVKNADLIKHLLVLLRRRAAPVTFEYVPGHTGEAGNERADALARHGASGPPVPNRTDWLVPSDEDAAPKAPTSIHVDIDPGWLMTPSELADLESELA
ncbi:hypothetical protein Q5752_005471 [Cryptotrichosporon argae]